eukprot:TRINITY_DN13131_c0_g2_i2.p3 TRINITY_DN13131_c0_g2~~TRINITY_DN13131_c0_g2_i2.p3  ORF type:complete len:110 (+),score=16.46 TRINITY_DN13131_c0_g2_i2:60-389(+)
MVAGRRPILPAILALALGLVALSNTEHGFVAPRTATMSEAVQTTTGSYMHLDSLALVAAAGMLTAQPAHALSGTLFDEVLPYACATSFAIIWGIVLGFVLLRLQEAFPE